MSSWGINCSKVTHIILHPSLEFYEIINLLCSATNLTRLECCEFDSSIEMWDIFSNLNTSICNKLTSVLNVKSDEFTTFTRFCSNLEHVHIDWKFNASDEESFLSVLKQNQKINKIDATNSLFRPQFVQNIFQTLPNLILLICDCDHLIEFHEIVVCFENFTILCFKNLRGFMYELQYEKPKLTLYINNESLHFSFGKCIVLPETAKTLQFEGICEVAMDIFEILLIPNKHITHIEFIHCNMTDKHYCELNDGVNSICERFGRVIEVARIA
jgi:hypothetical protein